LQTPHYSLNEASSSLVTNVIVATLKQTVNNTPINLAEIALTARSTTRVVDEVLTELTGLDLSRVTTLNLSHRFKIALEAVRLGASERAAKALTWQEFEEFAQQCLGMTGFNARRGVVFNDGKRRWQVDIAAVKDRTLLAIDCKHWESPNYSSKFRKAVEHQKQCLTPLIRHLRANGSLASLEVSALPMIITLFGPREPVIDKVVLVSVGQLPDFLEHMTPYDAELPFVSSHLDAESSIS
jgi:restriction endonuclease